MSIILHSPLKLLFEIIIESILINDISKYYAKAIDAILLKLIETKNEITISFFKNDKRNSSEVTTISSIMKKKIFYGQDPKFEPDYDHYFRYEHFIKTI